MSRSRLVSIIKVVVFVAALLPLAWLAWKTLHNDLGANPVEFITHATGDWALIFLLLSLVITPLRKLAKFPDLIRFRRMLGLYAFFYASLHLLTFTGLDHHFNWVEVLPDVYKRPFVTAGFTAWVLMVPLALTSTAWSIRKLGGKNWQRLHWLVYFSAIAAVVHYWWLVKKDITDPLIYGVILAVLLGARFVFRFIDRRPRTAAPSLASGN
jgi:sulfoxide reductase heme-binding subunit YedZ